MPHTFDIVRWAADAEAGRVPDRLPYGLHELESHGFDVSVRQRPGGGVLSRAVNRVGGGFEWSARALDRAPSTADLLMSWQETTAVPEAFGHRRDRPPLATGVIWLTDLPRWSPTAKMAAAALRRADAVWVLSQAQIPVVCDLLSRASPKVHFLPFGVNSDFWSSQESRAEGSGLVVSVGNDRDRDHTTLLRSFETLLSIRRNARLELVTSEPLKASPRVAVHPRLTHPALRDLYQRAEIAVVSTRPNLHVSGMTACLEAAAMGLPVVVTRTAGMADYVEDGVTGVHVPPGDPEVLAHAVDALLADPERASAMGRAGRELVERNHSHRTQARALADIAAEVLGS